MGETKDPSVARGFGGHGGTATSPIHGTPGWNTAVDTSALPGVTLSHGQRGDGTRPPGLWEHPRAAAGGTSARRRGGGSTMQGTGGSRGAPTWKSCPNAAPGPWGSRRDAWDVQRAHGTNEPNQLCDKGWSHACHELTLVRHHEHRCSTSLTGAGSTALPTVCTTAIPSLLIFFPNPSSRFPAVVTRSEPGCITVPKAGCPGSPAPSRGHRTAPGDGCNSEGSEEFNAINNPLMAIESSFPRNKFLPHQKEAANQCASRPFLTMGTRLAAVGSICRARGGAGGGCGAGAVPPRSPHGCEHQIPHKPGTKINDGVKREQDEPLWPARWPRSPPLLCQPSEPHAGDTSVNALSCG